ncbi:hypothetical protein V6N13_075919 [Hibiscus sabdariffa]|uniref:Uncharacterized protein n=1 Tax=Hibiscus sabdariffa TaxID=183260 RepID=A0ABR2UD24_9ROSI
MPTELAKIVCDFIAYNTSRVKRKDKVGDKTQASYAGEVTETAKQRHLPSIHLHTINISELVQTHNRDHEEENTTLASFTFSASAAIVEKRDPVAIAM